jgi:protein-disulfide isomerase
VANEGRKAARARKKTGPRRNAPATERGVDALGLAIVVGVAALLLVSVWNWRQVGRAEEELSSRLGMLETRVAQVSDRVGRLRAPAAQPARRGPDPGRVYEIEIAGAPAKGPADAPVTIVEFSDFQCPFCRRAGPTLEKIQEVYGSSVRIVWKHHPLDMHRDAPAAHRASVAAQQQGKFWEFHDKLFDNQESLDLETFKQHARDLGMDLARFEQDLSSPETTKPIDADTAEARSLGVTGAPAFFINGRYLRGAKPFEDFARLISAELSRLGLPVPEGARIETAG